MAGPTSYTEVKARMSTPLIITMMRCNLTSLITKRRWDFPISSDALSSGKLNVVFDVISGQTHISVNAETYSPDY